MKYIIKESKEIIKNCPQIIGKEVVEIKQYAGEQFYTVKVVGDVRRYKVLESELQEITDIETETIELIANFLGLENRIDFREHNRGNIIPLNFNLKCDIAHIRKEFKRHILSNCYNEIKVMSGLDGGYIVLDGTEDLDILENRNKIIDRIQLALSDMKENNIKCFGMLAK